MKNGVVFIITMLSLLGCSYTHVKGASGTQAKAGDIDNCGPVDFATINAKVFKKNCTGCHNPNSGEDVKGLFFVDYFSIKNAVDASVRSVLAGRMPKGGRLGQTELDLLLAWQKQGAPEVTAEPPVQACSAPAPVAPVDPGPVAPVDPGPVDPPVDVLEANYNSIRKHILEVKCSGCHGINDTKPKPAKHQFDTYAEISQYAHLFTPANDQSRFAQAVITGDMPLFGDLLTDEEINVVVEWIAAGIPETKGGPPALLPDVIMNMSAN